MAKKIKVLASAMNELNPHHKRLLDFVDSQTTNVSDWLRGLIERENERVQGGGFYERVRAEEVKGGYEVILKTQYGIVHMATRKTKKVAAKCS